MHQPFYKDELTGRYTLPWVRLHAAKDYLHMAEVLARYPGVKATFNFVPSLLEQIEDYAAGRAEDEWEAIARRGPVDDDEKRFMLDSFFSISLERFIRRCPRYWQLLQLRNAVDGQVDLLSDGFWTDLSALFNLAWVEPTTIERDRTLSRLVAKGGRYTKDDVAAVLQSHHRIAAEVLPTYRKLAARGQVELSTSPYFHPILPLLVDTRAAWEASPGMTLPNVLFHYPEDAREQLRLAREAHERWFGEPPAGLWPSEGALSHDACGLVAEEGWRWAATDEAVLAGSLGVAVERDGYGHVTNPKLLYQPYRFGDSDLTLVFRDRNLADRIGFVYRHMGGREAADDLIHRLHVIRDRLGETDEPYLVPIILDGENCWEEYAENGNEFLNALYAQLAADQTLETVTLTDYLVRHPARASVGRVRAGSWIFGNLETWVGEDEQNRAWEYLALTRTRLVQWQATMGDAKREASARAWRELRVAEGSDWFWWYYSRNKFGHEAMFDREFRAHLGNVYRAIGVAVPPWLGRPILGDPPDRFRLPVGYILPRLAAEAEPTLEWANAGFMEPRRSSGVMQQGSGLLGRVYFGFNPADLHVRIEAAEELDPYSVAVYLSRVDEPIWNARPRFADQATPLPRPDARLVWEIALPPHTHERAVLARAAGAEEWEGVGEAAEVSRKGGVVELAVSLERLGLKLGDRVGVVVVVARDRRIVEIFPGVGDEPDELSFTLAPPG